MKFNINHMVRVKLTDKGRAIHRENWEILSRKLGYCPPVEDKNGWSTWQMWSLMNHFGEHLFCGSEPPFETTIDIVVKPAKGT